MSWCPHPLQESDFFKCNFIYMNLRSSIFDQLVSIDIAFVMSRRFWHQTPSRWVPSRAEGRPLAFHTCCLWAWASLAILIVIDSAFNCRVSLTCDHRSQSSLSRDLLTQQWGGDSHLYAVFSVKWHLYTPDVLLFHSGEWVSSSGCCPLSDSI